MTAVGLPGTTLVPPDPAPAGTAATSPAPAALPGSPVATIVIAHASRWYGNVVAVNDVSISLGPGITGLLGPNGAGKSTLLHLAAGLLRPSVGTVTILGQPVWQNPAAYRQIGLVPEREAVYPFLTGREFVRLNATLQRVPDPDAAARTALK